MVCGVGDTKFRTFDTTCFPISVTASGGESTVFTGPSVESKPAECSCLVVLLNLIHLALDAKIIGETRRAVIRALPCLNIGGEAAFRVLPFPLPVPNVHLGRREHNLVIPIRNFDNGSIGLSLLYNLNSVLIRRTPNAFSAITVIQYVYRDGAVVFLRWFQPIGHAGHYVEGS